MSVLRLATAGSVDDGKSTLIGRLLVDSHALLEDQLAAAREASLRRGAEGLDLALLTDGLRSEREQGITIDVAYRYFATARRKFVVADCPGHVEYTRNMVTGASTADAAMILIDAQKGPTEQTARHAAVAAALRVPHTVFVVNKMDAVGFSKERFAALVTALETLARETGLPDAAAIPVSALTGDNVVVRSARMPWYTGESLLSHLERLDPGACACEHSLRLPVQLSLLPARDSSERRYGGWLAGGCLAPGDPVLHVPTGRLTTVASLELGGKPIARARAPHSVTVALADEFDVGRGDMLASPAAPPRLTREVEATLFWLGEAPLAEGRAYVLRHTSAEARAFIVDAEKAAATNEFARARLRCSRPLACDPYAVNRVTGSFILIDEATNATVAAGMIL